MNKYIIGLIAFLLMISSSNAQIEIKSFVNGEAIRVTENILIPNIIGVAGVAGVSLKGGRIETSNELSIQTSTLNLTDISIKARKMTLGSTLTTLNINGQVKVEVDNLILGTGGAVDVKIMGTGTLTFYYKQLTNAAGGNTWRAVSTPADGKDVTIRFEKMD